MNQASATSSTFDSIRPVRWDGGELRLIDQRKLPGTFELMTLSDIPTTARAITDMVVRGAPAIGITAAFAVVVAARQHYAAQGEDWRTALAPELDLLKQARPTAVNLAWAVERMQTVIDTLGAGDPVPRLEQEAVAILDEDIAANHRMGELGSGLIEPGSSVLTHCNAGALATGGYGTALGVIRAGVATGRIDKVFADETRPWMQGSRLTAWELLQDGIPVTLLGEGAAAHLMKSGAVHWVVVGSDRIAANGDVANKIGTYSLAVNARYHGVKFMVVAPTSTVDMACPSGSAIPIEQRPVEEVLYVGGQRLAAEGAQAWNPAFDVTPADLVDAIVTERGVVEAPTAQKMIDMMAPG